LYRRFHCDISIYTYSVPWLGSPPPSCSLIPLYLKWFHKLHCSVFIQAYKVHWPCSPSLNLSNYPPPPTNIYPITRSGLHSCPSLFVYSLFKGVSPWYFTCTLISLPLITLPYSLSHPLIIQQFSVISFCLLSTKMQCILMSFYHSLFLPHYKIYINTQTHKYRHEYI
jgi:hypothetical protein